MATDDFDPSEIDRMVQELAAPRRPPAPKPVVASPAASVTTAPPAGAPNGLTPGRTWTTARVLMPAARTERTKPAAVVALASLGMRVQVLARTGVRALRDTSWSALSVRTFVGLGVLLGAAMPYWPYAHAWSWGLLGYLLVVELLVVTGIWGAKLTWDARLPAAHTVAVGTVVWGLGLLAAEAVPRIGYA